MSGQKRRELLAERLRGSSKPVTGSSLAKMMGVSRQVIVQDIAILRTGGMEIVSTNRGYIAPSATAGTAVRGGSQDGLPKRPTRLFKVRHGVDQTEEELNAIVDMGGRVEDVMVNHRSYGTISVELGIKSRKDVAAFMDKIQNGKSSPLMLITDGYHFHHVSADTEEELDDIERMLSDMGLLVMFSDYERAVLV